MTAGHDDRIRAARLKYNAALSAHQACARVLREATIAATVSQELIDRESRARRALDLAREEMLAAMQRALRPGPPTIS